MFFFTAGGGVQRLSCMFLVEGFSLRKEKVFSFNDSSEGRFGKCFNSAALIPFFFYYGLVSYCCLLLLEMF